jgi:hypothetical protein
MPFLNKLLQFFFNLPLVNELEFLLNLLKMEELKILETKQINKSSGIIGSQPS